MEDILTRFSTQKNRIPPIFMPLFEPHITKVRNGINKGLIDVAWNSLIHERYFEGVNKSLDELTRIVNEIMDLKEQRIDGILDEVANMEVIDLPTTQSFKVNLLGYTFSYNNNLTMQFCIFTINFLTTRILV